MELRGSYKDMPLKSGFITYGKFMIIFLDYGNFFEEIPYPRHILVPPIF